MQDETQPQTQKNEDDLNGLELLQRLKISDEETSQPSQVNV